MALDLAALKAKIAAKKAAETKEKENVPVQNENSSTDSSVVLDRSSTDSSDSNSSSLVVQPVVETIPVSAATVIAVPTRIGTALTSELDHLDFLAKMNKLASAIQTAHPTMPVLLMQIHKQLRVDPELVTTLDEDAIGIIVSGLQIVTKTELVSVVVKESKSKAKKIAVTTDML